MIAQLHASDRESDVDGKMVVRSDRHTSSGEGEDSDYGLCTHIRTIYFSSDLVSLLLFIS